MSYFLNGMKYYNPTSIPYELDKNLYISNPSDFHPDNLFYIDSNAKSYMHIDYMQTQVGSPIEFLEMIQPKVFKEKNIPQSLLEEDYLSRYTSLNFNENYTL